MTHLVYLHPHFTIEGGAGRYVLETGSRLAARGYRVTVITIRADEKIVGPYRESIRFVELGGALTSNIKHWLCLPWFLLRLERQISELRPDILFPQVFPANWWGLVYKLFHRRVPLVWMCQEPSAFIHSKTWIEALPGGIMKVLVKLLNPALKILDRFLCTLADLVLVNSAYGKEYALAVYGYQPDRVLITYLGFDEQQFTPNTSNSRAPQIVTIGRLTRFKNVDVLVRAVRILKDEGVGCRVKIIGRGEEEEALQSLTRSLGLSDVIDFMGAVPAPVLTKTLQDSKALTLCSVDEPFGLVAVEAMACGTPVIAVNAGGPAETVEDSMSGFLIPGRDASVLASAITRILLNEETFQRMSQQAAERAKRFTWSETVESTDQAFQKILGN